MLLNRLGFICHFSALLVLLCFSLSECILNTTVTWFWHFHCITSNMSFCYCPCTWRGAQMSCWYDLHICLGLESFLGCWLRHWPNTISADPEQIAEEPSHRTTQNTMFCGTKCKGGICLYVFSTCPQLHFSDRLTYVETRPTHDSLPHIGCVLCFEMFIQTSFQRTGNIK